MCLQRLIRGAISRNTLSRYNRFRDSDRSHKWKVQFCLPFHSCRPSVSRESCCFRQRNRVSWATSKLYSFLLQSFQYLIHRPSDRETDLFCHYTISEVNYDEKIDKARMRARSLMEIHQIQGSVPRSARKLYGWSICLYIQILSDYKSNLPFVSWRSWCLSPFLSYHHMTKSVLDWKQYFHGERLRRSSHARTLDIAPRSTDSPL
jgi:hypothetical protein